MNKYSLQAWCKTSLDKTLRLSNAALGHAFVPFIFKLIAQSNYPQFSLCQEFVYTCVAEEDFFVWLKCKTLAYKPKTSSKETHEMK